ncbi:acyl-CoA dehydrogenase family protein [Cupriavidus basilensis]
MGNTDKNMAMAARKVPWMNEELGMFQDTVRRFVERELVPNEARWAERGYIDRRSLEPRGRSRPAVRQHSGRVRRWRGNFAHEAVICIEMARAIATSLGNGVHSGIVAHYLLNYGTEAQKRKWLPQMASGAMVAAIAMSEPGAGSDLKSVRTRAVREKTQNGDIYRINGAKTFITNGYHADLICVVAKTDPEAGARGVSLIMVETRDLPGFRRGRILEKIGQKGQDTAELFFDDVCVPVDNLLGEEEGQGFYQLMQQLPQERMIIALGAVASMQRAIELTTDYVRERQVFGKPLIDMRKHALQARGVQDRGNHRRDLRR